MVEPDPRREHRKAARGEQPMLLAEFIAGAVMLTATALGALDTRPGRAALYAVARYRRRRRARHAR
jgi:hypothetical protein